MPSLAELQAAARTAGLSPYGSKPTLEARLNAHAAKELSAQESDSEAALVASEPPVVSADADAAATTPVMQASAKVKFAEDGRTTPAGLIIPTAGEVANVMSADSAGRISLAEAERNLADMKSRYPGLNVRLDTNQECFVFEGGLQGRVTTTMHQPLKALMHNISGVAPGYITAHQAAVAARGAGLTGDLLGRSAVYE